MFNKEVIGRIGAVEQEWRAASFAVTDLNRRSHANPTILTLASVTPADVRTCLDNLQPTYLVRKFAVFEEALREIWREAYRRSTRPETYVLIQRCAARQHVPAMEIEEAHRVREYRNAVVHGGDAPLIPLPEARTALCKFFGRMPRRW